MKIIVYNKNNEIILNKNYEREVTTYPSALRMENKIIKVSTFMNIILTEEEIVHFYSKMGNIEDKLKIIIDNGEYSVDSKDLVIINDVTSKNYSIEMREEIEVK